MLNRKRFYVTTAALFGSVMMGLNCGSVYALDDSPAVAAEVANDTTVKDTYISYADGVKKNNVNTLVKAYVELPNSVKVKLVRDHVRILLYDKLTGPAEKMTYAASSYSAPEYFSYDKAGDAKLDNMCCVK